MSKQITRQKAVELIENSGGTVFACTFLKRETKEERVGRFRLGRTVKKGLAGGPPAYDPKAKNLIWVYRMAGDVSESATDDDKNRRSIPIEGIQRVTIGGETYIVGD